jgi:polyhydroxybutyrate depolymerase
VFGPTTRAPVGIAIVIAAVLALAAPPAGAANGAGAASASGCGAALTPGTATQSLDIAGRMRMVVVHVPTGYSGRQALPLVLNLHGSGSTASAQELFTGMDATADANGFVVAYPQAALPDGSGFDWNVPGQPLVGGRRVPKGAPDDVAFLEQLVPALGRRYCIDASQVGVTGFSGGARLASQLGCDAGAVFDAIAPVSGLRFPSPCASARAVPILSMHGTEDPVDPYRGHGQPYWTYSVPVAAKRWASHDGCARTAATTHPAPDVTRTAYGSCRDGATVELYTIAGEGHEWPGGPKLPTRLTRALGPQRDAIDADNTIWSFFVAHGL